uniref:AIG1-type G domain-containing protein n=1 Tax=Kalanchoe fedtschenkoi TaxID=63787 RepID=A0A7N0UQG1_KALFE
MGEIYVCGDGVSKVRTIVLVGKTGNGKSATANSILGRKVFESRLSSSGVTATSQMRSGLSKSGQHINIIDTPGLFDFTEGGTKVIAEEIAKCVDLAGFGGIDAIVFVLSLRSRFSQEEEAAFRSLKALFGPRIIDYMIIVFTGGDDLEDIDFDEYIGQPDIPQPLKEIIRLCENRTVVFNNKTKDQWERLNQSDKLWCILDEVVARNGGEPYREKMAAGSLVAVEAKLNQTKAEMEKKLVEKQLARSEAERQAAESRRMAEDETRRLKEALETAQTEERLWLENLIQKERDERFLADAQAREATLKTEAAIAELHSKIDQKCTIL